MSEKCPPPIVVKLMLNGKYTPMELDTGAAVTMMSEVDFVKNFPSLTYQSEEEKLGVYNGTSLEGKGVAQVEVCYGDLRYHLPLLIGKHEKGPRMPTLLGLDWLPKIKVNLHEAVQNLHELVLKVQ